MKSYIKFLSRNKFYSLIEAIGLSVSLAFVILLGTYIWQQYKVINENPDADRIYVIGRADGHVGLSMNEKPILESNTFPEIEDIARYELNELFAKVGSKTQMLKAAVVDKEWFDIFPYYEIISGSAEDFNDPNNVFVSRSYANTLGDEDAVIGMTFTDFMSGKEYVICGIIEDFQNTLFQRSDVLMNIRSVRPDDSAINYSSFGFTYTFLKMSEGVDISGLETKLAAKLQDIEPRLFFGDSPNNPEFYSIKDTFFNRYSTSLSSANTEMLRILMIIAIALLVSAIFNYMNLSIALITKRAKEMATRRLVGADRKDILFKCIIESVFFTVICFAVAVMLAVAFEPMLNSLLVNEKPDSFVPVDIPLDFMYVFVCMVSAVILGVIVGLVPAWAISSFAPIDVIKGAFRTRSKMVFSKCFIVVQSTLAVTLIAMGILMEAQLSRMVNVPKNSNVDNIFFFGFPFMDTPAAAQPLYDALMKNPDVQRVGFGEGFPGQISNIASYVVLDGPDGNHVMPRLITCDSVYFKMLNPALIEDRPGPLLGSLWISESVSESMDVNGVSESVFFTNRYNYTTDHLGGVYKDIPIRLEQVGDSAIEVLSWDKMYVTSMFVETVDESEEIKRAILKLQEELADECFAVSFVYESGFINDILGRDMAPTVRFIRLVEIFMVLAVLLSLMGLVAMSTYFSEQKSHEIAVRKVFGGTIGTETVANVRSYMIMVATACAIGVPIAVYAAGRYLEQFAYRIENYWWIFALAVLAAFAMSLLSVLWQTLKAARTNPSEELKKE